VVADLVPVRDDLAHPVAVLLRHPPGDEERGLEVVPAQEREDLRHRHLGPVRALGERAGPFGVGRILADPDLLGVEVERESRRRALAVGPHGSSPGRERRV
jgi:hypothetical protein